MKKRIYKVFLVLMVGLSLSAGPIAQNEIAKMLEALSGQTNVQVQVLDEEKESEEIKKRKKKLLKYFPDIS